MISLLAVFSILILHFVFDFFYQTDEMAQGKSKHNSFLWDHVWVYTIGLVLMALVNLDAFYIFYEKKMGTAFIVAGFWVVINLLAHFFTDYFSSRASSRLYKDQEFHDFFGTIGLDQLVHYITLFGTFYWLTH